MNSMRNNILLILFLTVNFSLIYGQDDNIKEDLLGDVKSMRVTLEFINDSIRNLKVLDMDDDYGHMGFISPKAVKSNFDAIWYETTATRYLNYYQERDNRDSIIKELWLNKKNEVVEDYRYRYNKNSNYNITQDTSEFEKKLMFEKYCDYNTYYYDENLLIKTVEEDYWADHEDFITYIYNKDKNLVNKFRYTIISNDSKYIDGNLYFYEDSLLSKTTPYSDYVTSSNQGYENIYDKHRRLIEVNKLVYYKWIENDETRKRIYTPYPSKRSFKKFQYDDHDNIIREDIYTDVEKYNDSVRLFSTIKKTYSDNLETETKKTGYYMKDHISKSLIKRKYDNKQRLILYQRFYQDSLELTRKYSYNSKNQIISLLIRRKGENKRLENGSVEYKYQYDSKGNWTQQIKSVDGKELFIWSREIKYYN